MTRINKNNYKHLNESIMNMNGPQGGINEQWGRTGDTGGSGGWPPGLEHFENCFNATNPTTWCLNNYDFNGDGVVDVNDLLWWLANYGGGTGGTGGTGGRGGFAPPGGGSPSFGHGAPPPKRPFGGFGGR